MAASAAGSAAESAAQSQPQEWTALDLAARCEKALALQRLVALCSTSGALAIRGLESPCCVPAAPPLRRQAWVTLLTNAPYARGAVALAHSLSEAESQFPLIVLVTDGVPEAAREQCIAAGCEVREVAPLPLPPGVGGPPSYACEHFAECWSKLRVWELEDEFEQLVLLDADMIVLKNMDELLTTPLDASLVS